MLRKKEVTKVASLVKMAENLPSVSMPLKSSLKENSLRSDGLSKIFVLFVQIEY